MTSRKRKQLRLAVAVLTAGVLAIVPLTYAFAKIHGAFSASPTSVAPGSNTGFTLSFDSNEGSAHPDTGDNACLLSYQLVGFTPQSSPTPTLSFGGGNPNPAWTFSISGDNSSKSKGFSTK